MRCSSCSVRVVDGTQVIVNDMTLCALCVADAYRGFRKSHVVERLSSSPYQELFSSFMDLFTSFRKIGNKRFSHEKKLGAVYQVHTRLLLFFLSKNDTPFHPAFFRLAGWFEQSLYDHMGGEGHLFLEEFLSIYDDLTKQANVLFTRLEHPDVLMRMDLDDLEAGLHDVETRIVVYEGEDKEHLERLSLILLEITDLLQEMFYHFQFPNPGYFKNNKKN